MRKSAAKTMDRPVEAAPNGAYQALVGGIASVIDEARRAATRSVNAAMTAAYWLIGRHIVKFEQGAKERADYGSALLRRLATDLVQRFGRGFSRPNLQQMRLFYLAYPPSSDLADTVWHIAAASRTANSPGAVCRIRTPRKTANSVCRIGAHGTIVRFCSRVGRIAANRTASLPNTVRQIRDPRGRPPKPRSGIPLAVARLRVPPSAKNPNARQFHEAEALRGGWPVRQLDRQGGSQFYEGTTLSKDKAKMLKHGAQAQPTDALLPEQTIRGPVRAGVPRNGHLAPKPCDNE